MPKGKKTNSIRGFFSQGDFARIFLEPSLATTSPNSCSILIAEVSAGEAPATPGKQILKNSLSWDITPCSPLNVEDEGSTVLRQVWLTRLDGVRSQKPTISVYKHNLFLTGNTRTINLSVSSKYGG